VLAEVRRDPVPIAPDASGVIATVAGAGCNKAEPNRVCEASTRLENSRGRDTAGISLGRVIAYRQRGRLAQAYAASGHISTIHPTVSIHQLFS